MRSLFFWLAFPLLVPQALWVRRTAPRFAAAGGPNNGRVGEGDRYRLLAFGDSIIAGVGASRLPNALVGQTARALADSLSCQVRWTAHGYSGANSTALLHRHLPELPSLDADLIITSVGINDVTSLTTVPRWRRNLATLFEHLTEENQNVLIAFAGLPPLGGFPLLPQPLRAALGVRARHFDDAAKDVIARYPQVVHVPVEFETTPDKFALDGYHPSEASYVTFGQSMAERIVECLANR